MDLLERIVWMRPEGLSGLEMLSATHNTSPFGQFHSRYGICAGCGAGAGTYTYRGRSHYVEAGRIGIFEPGEIHATTRLYGPSDFTVLFLPADLVRRAAEEEDQPGSVHFPPATFQSQRLALSIQDLARAVQAAEPLLALQTRLTLILHELRPWAETPRKEQRDPGSVCIIQKVEDYLREHWQENVDLEDLAALTGLGRFSLVHAFTRMVGVPPHHYLIHVRVEHARRLLEAGLAPATVAAEVGFADQSHLYRHFKRIMQVTPGQYAHASGQAPWEPANWRKELAMTLD